MPGKKESAVPKSRSTEFIDLNLRIKNDGGPMFAFLSSISDPYARGDRVRQLIYLGMLAERGMVGMAFAQQPAPSPIPPSSTPGSRPVTKEVEPQAPSEVAPLQFEADDLSAIFGTAKTEPNLGA